MSLQIDPTLERRLRRRENEKRRRAKARAELGPSHRRAEWERKHARLMAERESWLAAGPRCSWCTGPIEKIPKTGPLPEMCSKKCRLASWAKRTLDERRAAGLCQDGCGRPRTEGSARCAECLVQQREYHRERRAPIRKVEPREDRLPGLVGPIEFAEWASWVRAEKQSAARLP